ncbi:MAG TPA: MraY family glycosyltransferase [Gemmatimonadales bacterium]|nr:MraY family glycosyltransferase [Gemmatimonadales bacterium]
MGTLLTALAVTMLATPLARRLAVRTAFFDHPVGYKEHSQPTPYLGGAAVMAGVMAGTVIGGAAEDYKRLLVAALVLFAIGTLDDRLRLGVTLRLIAQVATAVALWAVDLGWTMLPSHSANLVLTVVWVVGITNAFNLMDNQDGATGTIGAVCGVGIGTLALIQGAVPLGVIAFSLSGACLGFLHFNLAKPARIFLGDGGSMPIGLLVACTIMAIPDGRLDWTLLFAAAPLAGLPILDTTLVVISRHRRGAPILSGDRAHLTHRLLATLGSERKVALVLAAAQAALCGLSIALFQLSQATVVAAAAAYLAVGAAVIMALETVALSPAPEPAFAPGPEPVLAPRHEENPS